MNNNHILWVYKGWNMCFPQYMCSKSKSKLFVIKNIINLHIIISFHYALYWLNAGKWIRPTKSTFIPNDHVSVHRHFFNLLTLFFAGWWRHVDRDVFEKFEILTEKVGNMGCWNVNEQWNVFSCGGGFE